MRRRCARASRVLHGNRTYLLQDEHGQITETHSISAGLDYPGVGPEHAWLKETAGPNMSHRRRRSVAAFTTCAAPRASIRRLNPRMRSPRGEARARAARRDACWSISREGTGYATRRGKIGNPILRSRAHALVNRDLSIASSASLDCETWISMSHPVRLARITGSDSDA